MALAQSNSAQEVEECTRAGFALLPDAVAASKKLCELKGIGPATASGASLSSVMIVKFFLAMVDRV